MPIGRTRFAVYLLICVILALLLTQSQDEYSKPRELEDQYVFLVDSYATKTRVKPPLRTQGRHVVDSLNNTVKLISVNWYGASDISFIPLGLDKQPRHRIAAVIRDLGFNSVRLPYSDEMVVRNPPIDPSLLSENLDLVDAEGGARALEVFTAVIESLTAAGLMVIVNDHITQAAWCCGANPCDGGWANDWFGGRWLCPVTQSQEQWITNWETVMRPFVQNELVVAADLRNEVRGLWGTLHWDSWAEAAELASERLLALNPNWLMIVEGISSANDLMGVRSRPVTLSIPNRVVYSAHVYSWSGWGSLRPFAYRSYESFAATMWSNWAYILAENLAPVWVGEVGTSDQPSRGDMNYWTHLIYFLQQAHTGWGYWAINPRKPAGNEWETYGLLLDDWKTVRRDYRLENMSSLGLVGNA